MKPLKNRYRLVLITLVLTGMIGLVACNSQTAAVADQNQEAIAELPSPIPPTEVPEIKQLGQTEAAEPAPTVVEPTAEAPTAAMEDQDQAPEDEGMDTAPTQVVFVPSTRTEYTPTDPSLVTLESGQLQFVKFFAFW